MTKFNFEEFREKFNTDEVFRESITPRPSEVIDLDHGYLSIARENLSKYLERYMCKDEIDLQDTLWYNYGVYVRIFD
jgi:hypothetical protein